MADELSLTPAEGLTVVWDREAVASLAASDGDPGAGWRLDGSLDPDFSTLRVISGATADGSVVLLCAARPAGAAHHDEEAVAAVVTTPDGGTEAIEEALVSTEYADDRTIHRVGLELYKAGDDYPLRAAGDATRTASSEADGERRNSAHMSFRLGGSEGTALYEIIQSI